MGPRSRWTICWLAVVFASSSCTGCGDDNPGPPSDVTPPGRVTDLRAVQRGATAALLLWTAPGDDGHSGRASAYDARRARFEITAANWPATDPLPGLGAPKTAGQPESLLVSGLVEGERFYFALRATDEAGNESRISNLPTLITDVTPPAPADSLEVLQTAPTAIRLGWKVPGDDGVVGRAQAYDLRHALEPLSEASWTQATRVSGLPLPLPPGGWQSFLVSRLSPGTDYWFALKVADEAGNESPLSAVVRARTAD